MVAGTSGRLVRAAWRPTGGLLTNAMTSVGIVVPVYRNAQTLAALAGRVRAAMLGGSLDDYRLLFIVDASPDESWDVVRQIVATDCNVVGLLLSQNVGQHAAILAGLRAVDAESIAVMDADLQDPPELLPAMVKLARESGSTVFAERRGRYQSRVRMLTSRGFKTLLSWITGVPADVGTFLVMPAVVATAVRECAVRSPQIVVLAHHFSRTVAFLPFDRPPRANGTSSYSAVGRLRAAGRSLRCAFGSRRLTSHPNPSAITASGSRYGADDCAAGH
jgi:glycosyltransferase involved in cell wall biosynthesis